MLKKSAIIVLALGLPALIFSQNKELIGARFPSLSPDGEHICFSYMGDLWMVASQGGRALRLTDNQAYDQKPVWSPDGRWIAFTSNREGNDDIYVIPSQGGEARRLTWHSGGDVATGWSSDSQWIIFRSGRDSGSGLYKIARKGGNAFPLLDSYWTWCYSGRMSPDGLSLLFSEGTENGYRWRRGYRGSNSAALWILSLQDGSARQLVKHRANSFWPSWGDKGSSVYYISDRETGVYNLWKIPAAGGEPTPVTSFTKGDARFLSVASSASRAVFERNFTLWLTDLKSGESRPVHIEAPSERKENNEFYVKNGRVSEFALAPDGKKIAAVVRGDIFILSTKGAYARNITESPWRESNPVWDKDSHTIIYVSDKDANPDLYRRSALGEGKPQRLTSTEGDVLYPKLSPNGEWIAYASGPREIRLIKPDGSKDRLLIKGNFGGRFGEGVVWSPDSRYLAVVEAVNGQNDIFAVEIESGKKTLLTNTAYDESDPVWSPDGEFLLFRSNRYGHSFPEFSGKWDIYQLYFKPEKPEFKEDTFEKLFREEKSEKEKPDKEKKEDQKIPRIAFQLDNLDVQTKVVTNTLGDDYNFVLSPKDTSTVYFVSNIDGKRHFWQTSLKKGKRNNYTPFVPGVMNPSQLTMDQKGQYLYYLSSGHISRISLAGKSPETISFPSKITVERTADYRQMLGELYYVLQYYYYDPDHHNADWEALYKEYLPVLEQVRCDEDFYEYANQLIGNLNSSHTGIRGPGSGSIENPSGHVGAEWSIQKNGIFLEKIYRDGPLWLHRDSVSAGDKLLTVNGKKADPAVNLWALLNGTPGKRLTLVFAGHAKGEHVTVNLEPISASQENRLLLEDWIRGNAETVKKATDDNVAYIYMRAMGGSDLRRFLKELERDAVPRKGLILDLRYNFGGNVHDRVLKALTAPVYASWKIRGMEKTQQSTFGFNRTPVVLLVNEVTLSDGEMTSNGFKALERGPIVGNTTYGWLIFTTGASLMNGGYFRLPFWGCYTLDGTDLETHGGVNPDVLVINTLDDKLAGKDPQLDKAIEVILEKIKK